MIYIYGKEKRITPSRSVIARRIIQTIRARAIAVCLHAFAHTHLRNDATSVGALWAVSNAPALAWATADRFAGFRIVYAHFAFFNGALMLLQIDDAFIIDTARLTGAIECLLRKLLCK